MKSVVLLKSGVSRRGGLEKWARVLSLAFLQKGCRVTLLTTGESPELPSEVEIHSLKKQYPMSVLRVRAFDAFCSQFLKTHKADLVFGLDRNSFQTHLRAGNGVHRAYLEQRKKQEGPLAHWGHLINPLHRTLLSLEKRAFLHPELKCLFVNSEMVKREILTYYPVDARKIHVIHNGVEWTRFSPGFSAWPEKYKNEGFQFLFVGHGFRRKGLERLMRGLSLLNRKEVHLSVVGKDKELPYFKALAEKLKVRALFHGEQSDMVPFYQQADALVIPSFYDPFANVTVEALAFGLYVVSSKYNGGSEVLTKDTGCLIEDLGHDESVARALEEALKHPKTIASADRIRNSIQSLDFPNQLSRFMELSLEC